MSRTVFGMDQRFLLSMRSLFDDITHHLHYCFPKINIILILML